MREFATCTHCPSASPSPARPWSRGAPRVEERIGATPGGAIQAPKARRRVVPSGSEKVTAPKSMPKLLSRVPPLPGVSVTHTRHSLPPLFPQEHSILCPPSSARRGYSPRPSTIHRPPPSSSGADARCRWRNAVCGKALRARRARDEAEPLSLPPLPLSPVVRAPPGLAERSRVYLYGTGESVAGVASSGACEVRRVTVAEAPRL